MAKYVINHPDGTRTTAQRRGMGSAFFTIFAVLLLIGLCIEYWWLIPPTLIVAGLVIWGKIYAAKHPETRKR